MGDTRFNHTWPPVAAEPRESRAGGLRPTRARGDTAGRHPGASCSPAGGPVAREIAIGRKGTPMRRTALVLAVTTLLGAAAAGAAGKRLTLGVLTGEIPESWQTVPPASNFRMAQYRLPGAAGDQPAEFIVFFFEGGGGTAAQNIARWRRMFKPPDGRPSERAGKTETLKRKNVTITTLDVSGTYLQQPFPGSPSVTERLGYRMLNAVVEVSGGPFYFRLVGPAKTVAAHKGGWDRLIKTLGP